jgi:hypothetical protein
MKIHIFPALLPLAFLFFLPAPSSAEGIIAFEHVDVIPMTGELVLEDQTVLVEEGVITGVGTSGTITLPSGAKRIDGKGAFLMPGLADMHTHLYPFLLNPSGLRTHLAHGVTTVRSMSGTPENLAWRKMVESGEIPGPAIYTSGRVLSGLYGQKFGLSTRLRLFHTAVFLLPLCAGIILYIIARVSLSRHMVRHEQTKKSFSRRLLQKLPLIIPLLVAGMVLSWLKIIPFMIVGRHIITPDYYISENTFQAEREVIHQKNSGYDFLKVYDFLTDLEYLAAVRMAREQGFYVAGHAPDQIPLEIIAASGQNEIAHIDELQSYHWIGYNRGIDPNPSVTNKEYPYDYDMIPHTVELISKNGMNAVSTLVVKETMYRLIGDPSGVLDRSEYRLVGENSVDRWRRYGKSVTSLKNQGNYRKTQMQPFLIELTKALHAAGVTITIGTDASVEGMIPGFHLLRELEILVEAGFTPFEALEMGTKNAGTVVGDMGFDGNFGTIQPGMRADLLLLEGNPLDDIGNVHRRIGVMAGGRWYPQEDLDEWTAGPDDTY